MPGLQARAADETDTGLGWTFASVFDELLAAADGFRAAVYSVTIDIPDPDGMGSVPWSYTLSTTVPPPHPNNPSYPPWTRVSREPEARMAALAFAYVVTGDLGYVTNADGTGALDVALAVAGWSQWTDPGYGCGTGNSCLDTAHLTLGTSFVYDACFEALSDADGTALRTAIVELGIAPLRVDVAAGGAAAWFNGYALRVTGLAVGAAAVADDVGAAADPWLALAHDSIAGFLAEQGSDGGTWEGQLYGSYAVDNLVIGAHALDRRAGGDELLADPWLQDLPRFAAAFLGSDLRSLAPFGDSGPAVYWSTTMFALALASRVGATAIQADPGRRSARPCSFGSARAHPYLDHRDRWSCSEIG